MSVDKLSVFFPVHNEEENITLTLEKGLKILKSLPLLEYEVLLVENGSKDKSPEVVDDLAKKHPGVKSVHIPTGGYGYALRAGFDNAKYDWVIYSDADGQFDFAEITRFLEKADKPKAIWGYRMKRQDPIFRLLAAKGWALSLFILFGLRLKDVDCGFKMVHKSILDKIPKLESTKGGMINAELAYKTRKAGFDIDQVGVTHYPRMAGEPTGVKLDVIIQSYLDLLKLRLKLR